MTAQIVLLVNPAAGRGRAARVAQAVHAALTATGLLVEAHETRARGDEARIARDASAAGARALAVVGGDGAISHAVRGLLDGEGRGGARVPLAIFAAGTGNDLAKSLAVPVHHVQRMAAHVAAGATRHIDVGFVNDVPFVNAAIFGFDVDVLERVRTRSNAIANFSCNSIRPRCSRPMASCSRRRRARYRYASAPVPSRSSRSHHVRASPTQNTPPPESR